MDTTIQDTLAFFERHQAVYPLYACFQEKLLARFPESRLKVQKSQISYYNRHLYACVSFLKVKKKAELPEDYFVLTLGLSAPLESDRVAAKPSRIRGGGQRILSSAIRPIWTRSCLIGSSRLINLRRQNNGGNRCKSTNIRKRQWQRWIRRFPNGFDTGASVNRKEGDL